jgi:DNA helicase II / ATP-dependent DNA helicase PcrA
MPITPQQVAAAETIQRAAAHDRSPQVRLVAGPGTGKSFSIEERVRELLANGLHPGRLVAVSFTRASSVDLRNRIRGYCERRNQPNGAEVHVSTLHSLALRMLRAANLLHYPAEPLVLDTWELENVFDSEFGHTQTIGKERSQEIRREHEAFWGTGQWSPANYIPPDPPVTPAERTSFTAFHGPRTQTYSCVLPGEIVLQCVQQIAAGTLDPIALLRLEHLIVDEYQDLNPIDQQFIDQLIACGVTTFVAGDDDQSIYSFRYGSPAGIQEFVQRYPAATSHTLSDCFRCTDTIARAANALMTGHPSANRIPKTLNSLYVQSAPPVSGSVHRWRFNSSSAEAEAIASSCRDLIAAGLDPAQILILLSNQRELLSGLRVALDAREVPYEAPRDVSFIETDSGRFVFAMIRIACVPEDYVAHRLILGLRPQVGIRTTNAIAEAVIAQGANYRDIFYTPQPVGRFTGRALAALNHAVQICAQISTWQATDTLNLRTGTIATILDTTFNAAEAQEWRNYSAVLPPDMTLEELKNWMRAETSEQRTIILQAVFDRLNQPLPRAAAATPRVRVMSMHGAKGLSAQVVFVPGLEEHIFPGPRRQPYPGLLLEAARLLYVSITRARAACITSYSVGRRIQGRIARTFPCRFIAHLNGPFRQRVVGLQPGEIQQTMTDVGNL